MLSLALAILGTLTVDDDAPADFTTLEEAVNAAQAGDLILVADGDYGMATPGATALEIGKAVTILGAVGEERPRLLHDLVLDAGGVVVAGLRFDALRVREVKRRVRIDDCEVDCVELGKGVEVLMTRTAVDSSSSATECPAAIWIERARRFAFVDGTVHAPDADGQFESGSHGIFLAEAGAANPSRIWVAGSSVYAGDGVTIPFGGASPGGTAILSIDIEAPHRIDVTGSSSDRLQAGQEFGGAIQSEIVRYGGVSTTGPVFGAEFVAPPDPFLRVGGESVLGATRTVEVHGPLGQPALVLVALGSLTPSAIPGWSGELWLHPGTVVVAAPLSLAGQEAPSSLAVPVPADPTVLGLVAGVQALVQMPAGDLRLTNPDQIVPRPADV